MQDSSKLAQVEIGALDGVDYDFLSLSIEDSSKNTFLIKDKRYSKDEPLISLNVAPGSYKVSLDYYLKGLRLYSSSFCTGELYNADLTLVTGKNKAQINICRAQQDDAQLELTPVLVGNTAPDQSQSPEVGGSDLIYGQSVDRSSSWYVESGDIYYGEKKVKLKGINWFGFDSTYHGLHGLWSGRPIASFLDQIKGLGFNSLRIPLSPESLRKSTAGKDGYSNPVEQLVDLMQVAKEKNIYILLDFHTCSSAVGYLAASPTSCSGLHSRRLVSRPKENGSLKQRFR